MVAPASDVTPRTWAVPGMDVGEALSSSEHSPLTRTPPLKMTQGPLGPHESEGTKGWLGAGTRPWCQLRPSPSALRGQAGAPLPRIGPSPGGPGQTQWAPAQGRGGAPAGPPLPVLWVGRFRAVGAWRGEARPTHTRCRHGLCFTQDRMCHEPPPLPHPTPPRGHSQPSAFPGAHGRAGVVPGAPRPAQPSPAPSFLVFWKTLCMAETRSWSWMLKTWN